MTLQTYKMAECPRQRSVHCRETRPVAIFLVLTISPRVIMTAAAGEVSVVHTTQTPCSSLTQGDLISCTIRSKTIHSNVHLITSAHFSPPVLATYELALSTQTYFYNLLS